MQQLYEHQTLDSFHRFLCEPEFMALPWPPLGLQRLSLTASRSRVWLSQAFASSSGGHEVPPQTRPNLEAQASHGADVCQLRTRTATRIMKVRSKMNKKHAFSRCSRGFCAEKPSKSGCTLPFWMGEYSQSWCVKPPVLR